MRQSRVDRSLIACLVVVFVASVPIGPLLGQNRKGGGGRSGGGGGHALDANLQVGSGGYNRSPNRTNGSMVRNERYTPGSAKPIYTTSRTGERVYNPTNAFNPKSRYTATGYTGDYTSDASYQRFRYQGQY